ncbi:HPr family phosphocarrier protein [Stappia sp. F7233]|uniref:HPr family phosphocarrier protein n=1 Tax=Stappia albiluteola TaxID=2758565 RepID=A0A839ABK3_9HYPH|nr:HPr family phosphocarrier protein [Stappia albiluteola]MBA5776983.1 HPr family phosphocarrier protein [Stappia albiluteola]
MGKTANDEGAVLRRELMIVNRRGLHARASAKFVKLVEGFDADVTISKDGQSVGGTSIMGLMMLAASPGCSILVEARGPQAEAVVDALSALVGDGFGETD